MNIATFTIKGTTPYSQNAPIKTPKLAKETSADHEDRVWLERWHTDEKGFCQIPLMSIKGALSACAKRMGKQIPGKGKATYTKHFVSGILPDANMDLGIHKDDLIKDQVLVPSNGVTGNASKVWKWFGLIKPGWTAACKIHILDEAITKDVFLEVLEETGMFVGLGRFRPQNGGYYGRFEIEKFKWA